VVGYSYLADNTRFFDPTRYHAFRWADGKMADLGTLGGSSSAAYGVNGDGSIVVGFSTLANSGLPRAFRWSNGSMQDIGTLGGNGAWAMAVSADGRTIAGMSALSDNVTWHGVRWTGGIAHDLGPARANAVSADGAVIVGSGSVAAAPVFGDTSRAFRWTAATGFQDLNLLLARAGVDTRGFVLQSANAVSPDGQFIVGAQQLTTSSVPGVPAGITRAFVVRYWDGATAPTDAKAPWPSSTTAPTSAATVSSSTATSSTAATSSPTSMAPLPPGSAGSASTAASSTAATTSPTSVAQSPAGSAGSTATAASATPTSVAPITPIAGVTTATSVQKSIDDLAAARAGALAQQHGFATPLLGDDKPMGLGNEVGVFASAGSVAAGGTVYGFGDGLSLVGGLSFVEEDYPLAALNRAGTGALAVHYVYDNRAGWWRPFVEAGGWLAPKASLSFSRAYANGAGTARGKADTSGDLSYVYGRAGLLLGENHADQIAVSAELGRERMLVDAYAEQLSAQNPFEAHVDAGTDTMDLAKIRLQWSHAWSSCIDSTLWVAGVRGFNGSSGLNATVPGFGTLEPADLANATWAEFGGRVGFKLTEIATLDAYASGVAGGAGVETRVHFGLGLRFEY
jgi:probable HAF family extracellular repeat protein